MFKSLTEKLTMFLLKKQPHIKEELLEDYLDKKVISIRVNEFEDFRKSDALDFGNVILYRSVISHCVIKTEKIFAIGSNNILSGILVQPQEGSASNGTTQDDQIV